MGLTWNIDGGAQTVHIGDNEGSVTVPFNEMRRVLDALPPDAFAQVRLRAPGSMPFLDGTPRPPRFASLSGIEGEMFALDDAGRVWRWNGNRMVLCRCEAVSEDGKP